MSDEIIGCPFQKLRWVPSSIWSRRIQTALHCVVCDGAPFVLVTSHRFVALFGNNRLFRPNTVGPLWGAPATSAFKTKMCKLRKLAIRRRSRELELSRKPPKVSFLLLFRVLDLLVPIARK